MNDVDLDNFGLRSVATERAHAPRSTSALRRSELRDVALLLIRWRLGLGCLGLALLLSFAVPMVASNWERAALETSLRLGLLFAWCSVQVLGYAGFAKRWRWTWFLTALLLLSDTLAFAAGVYKLFAVPELQMKPAATLVLSILVVMTALHGWLLYHLFDGSVREQFGVGSRAVKRVLMFLMCGGGFLGFFFEGMVEWILLPLFPSGPW